MELLVEIRTAVFHQAWLASPLLQIYPGMLVIFPHRSWDGALFLVLSFCHFHLIFFFNASFFCHFSFGFHSLQCKALFGMNKESLLMRRVRRHHNHCEPFHFPYCLFCHFHLLFFANTFTFFFHFSFLSISIHPKEILLMRREGWGAITITSSPFTFLIQPPRAMFRKCSQPFGGVNKNLLFSEKVTNRSFLSFSWRRPELFRCLCCLEM